MPRRYLLLLSLTLCLGSARAAEQSSASIWPRIAAGMHLERTPRPEVQRWIASYTAHPAALSRMLERASPFLYFIVESAELRELPMELALLPAVESGFDAHARSRSAATGLWQFVPVTGKDYGLGENSSYDARRDPVASTRAALSHLQLLHGEFDDWLLALAAYNAGAGTLRRALRSAPTRDFWRLPLRQETRDYVPKLLALAAVVREPGRYGIRLPEIADRTAADLIATDRIALGSALKSAAVDEALLRRFNPGLKQTGDRAAAPSLLLPPSDALVVRAELAQAAAQNQPSWAPPPAEPLMLAADTRPDPLGLRQPSLPLRLDESPKPVAEPASAPPVTSPEPAGEPAGRHRVQPGETLFGIARKYRVKVEALRQVNRLRVGEAIAVGRELRLPAAAEN